MSPAWWHVTQLRWRIGATSLWYVGPEPAWVPPGSAPSEQAAVSTAGSATSARRDRRRGEAGMAVSPDEAGAKRSGKHAGVGPGTQDSRAASGWIADRPRRLGLGDGREPGRRRAM